MLEETLSPQRVFLDLRPAPKPELLRELARRLKEQGEIQDADAIADALIRREELITTGVKHGFAFPHTFSDQLDRLILTIGLVRGGTDYQALDGAPVEIIFLLLGPKERQDHHLRVLARLSNIAREPGMLEALRDSDSAGGLVGILAESDRVVGAH